MHSPEIPYLPLISLLIVCVLVAYNYSQISCPSETVLQANSVHVDLDRFIFAEKVQEQHTNFQPTNDGLVILIVSKQSAFKRREVIRKTWTSNFRFSYKFLIGKYSCLQEIQNQKYTCLEYNNWTSSTIYTQLLAENEKFNDLFLLDFVDTYHNLTTKIKFGLAKTVQYFDSTGNSSSVPKFELFPDFQKPKWLFKIDDDAIIFRQNLQTLLKKYSEKLIYNPDKYFYFGHFMTSKVVKNFNGHAKNVELIYSGNRYPRYASGASGYLQGCFVLKNSDNIT